MTTRGARAVEEDPTAREARRERQIGAMLLALALLMLSIRAAHPSFVWRLWTDRDLVRAADVWRSFPTMGAELTAMDDARLPGGAYALMLAPPVLVSTDPGLAWAWGHSLHGLAVLVVAWMCGRMAGPVAAGAAALTLTLAPSGWQVRSILWNPAFLDLPVALTLAGLLVAARGRPAGWLLAGLTAGIGTQVHLSVMAWFLPACLAAGIERRSWRGPGLAAAAWLATFLPYVLREATTGWPNTRTLLSPAHAGLPPTGGLLAGLARLPGLLQPAADQLGADGGMATAAARLAALPLGLTLIGLWRARQVPGAMIPAVGLLFGGISLCAQFGDGLLDRYLQVLLPLLAVLAGIGAATLSARLGPAAWLLAALLMAPALSLQAAVTGKVDPLDGWPQRERILKAAASAMHTDIASAAARIVLLRPGRQGWTWRQEDGVDWLLQREGLVHPGATMGPCLVISASQAGPPTAEDLRRVLPVIRILGEVPLAAGATGTLFETDARCPSSMVNRYVDTPAEALMRPWFHRLECGTTIEVDSWQPGLRRVLAIVDAGGDEDGCRRVAIMADIEDRPSGPRVTVHSNQLRGHAWFGGWFINAHASLDLVAAGPTGEIHQPSGPLGEGAAPTPWVIELPPGREVLRLQGTIGLGTDPQTWLPIMLPLTAGAAEDTLKAHPAPPG